MSQTVNQPDETLLLIARADDAASANAVNAAIVETIERGIIRNVSVMAVGPALEGAARLFGNGCDIAVGLHVTLHAEWTKPKWRPILSQKDVPSLLGKDGYFTKHPATLLQQGFSLDEMEAEAMAQLKRLREVGLSPVYLDTHMTFDWLPRVRPCLEALAKREGLVYDHANSHPRLPGTPGPLMDRIRQAAGGPWVLITHPACLSPELDGFWNDEQPPGQVATARDAERTALMDKRLLKLVKSGRVSLETYS